MSPLPGWFRASIRAFGTLVPPLMALIAYRLFWNLGTPARVRPEAAAVHSRAVTKRVAVNGKEAVVYRWGNGPRTTVLVHGWRGRGSQFAAIVAALESPDRTIVAFDAPGNGDSPGKRTDIRDYIGLISAIADESGGIDLLVGHSLGALAAFSAVREGVQAGGIVSIAGVPGIEYTVEAFSRGLGLPVRAVRGLRRRIERRVFNGDTAVWQRYVAQLPAGQAVPLLVVHDTEDRAVDFSEHVKIGAAHSRPPEYLHTNGLGHNRLLADPTVVEAIEAFAARQCVT